MVVLRSLALVAGLSVAGTAAAHVTLTPPSAVAGGYQVLRFGVGHGCGDRPTMGLRIEIPAGVTVARPQPKPGWTLSVQRAADGKAVAAVVWTGELPAEQFDEFLILVRLPDRAAPVAFPAVQSCGDEAVRWDETAQPGAPRPKRPAPTLTLTPSTAAPEDRHDHQH
jgi:uncharacterized protein YcnI